MGMLLEATESGDTSRGFLWGAKARAVEPGPREVTALRRLTSRP